jgi:SAM-dependent methyltransferase
MDDHRNVEFDCRSLLAMPSISDAEYWDQIGMSWLDRHPPGLWRESSDQQQELLLRRWLPQREGCQMLKTDLFDEVAGQGLVASLIGSGVHVTAIDISPWIVQRCRMTHPKLDAQVGDVRQLPFASQSFDVVFSGSTLDHFEHAQDLYLALAELRRVLRPAGLLIMTLDNPCHPLLALRNGPLLPLWRRIGLVPYRVGATLPAAALVEALRCNGLNVREVTNVGHAPRVLAVAAADWFERFQPLGRRLYLWILDKMELLEALPTARFTGHYTAILAEAPRLRTVGDE